MTRFLSLSLAVALAATAQAQPVVDGTVDGLYGSAIRVQTVQTQFGDNTDPNGFGGGGELDAAYGLVDNGVLYLMITGNQEPNFNKISIFIDSQSGGENTIDGSLAYDFNDLSQNLGGMTFDAGFEADYHLFGRWNGGAYELDIVDRAASSPGNEFGNAGVATVGVGTAVQSGSISAGGSATTNADGGGFLTTDVQFAFNNTNIAGVGPGTGAADQAAAAAVTTGLEIAIDLDDIGSPNSLIKVHVAYGNGDNNFHSNQILGGLPADTGNLGGPLSGIDFNSLGGEQFFRIAVPEPASALLVGLAVVGLAARRRV